METDPVAQSAGWAIREGAIKYDPRHDGKPFFHLRVYNYSEEPLQFLAGDVMAIGTPNWSVEGAVDLGDLEDDVPSHQPAVSPQPLDPNEGLNAMSVHFNPVVQADDGTAEPIKELPHDSDPLLSKPPEPPPGGGDMAPLTVEIQGHKYDMMRLTDDLVEEMASLLPDEPVSANDIHRLHMSKMTTAQRKVLRYAIDQCLSAAFGNDSVPPGLTHLATLHLDTGNHAPIQQKAYRSPYADRHHWESHIAKLLQHAIIRPSRSPWSSPALFVAKKNPSGEIVGQRMCIDYRAVNSTIRDCDSSYPIPLIDECLDSLAGAKYFTTLDVLAAYYTIAVEPDSIPKTAFVCPIGHYEFLRAPFGIKTLPGLWARIIDRVLWGLRKRPYAPSPLDASSVSSPAGGPPGVALAYFDDIIIASETFSDHLAMIIVVLRRLMQAGLTIKGPKCEWGRSEVEFLGFIASEDGVKPHPSKVNAVSSFPVPQNAAQLMSFTQLASYYRRFVKDFATVAAPLNEARKKNAVWKWGPEQQAAFDQLRSALSTAPVLSYPRLDQPFRLYTDASGYGLGAVLAQDADDGTERVVCFASRSMITEEKNYAATHKECLAVIWALRRFRQYLWGTRFDIVTDHAALQHLPHLKDPTGKLHRWAMELQEYNYTVIHRAGKAHMNADPLSRAPLADDNPALSAEDPLDRVSFSMAMQIVVDIEFDDFHSAFMSVLSDGVFPTCDDIEDDVSVLERGGNRDSDRSHGDSSGEDLGTDPEISRDDVVNTSAIPYDILDAQFSWRHEVACMQRADDALKALVTYKELQRLPKGMTAKEIERFKAEAAYFDFDSDGVLVHLAHPSTTRGGREYVHQIVIPRVLVPKVLDAFHDSPLSGGHMAAPKTYAKILLKYFWEGMRRDIHEYCRSCQVCQQRNSPKNRQKPGVGQHVPVSSPFERIGIDYLTIRPPSARGNVKVLVVTDHLTKYAEAFSFAEENHVNSAWVLFSQIVCRHGCPRQIATQ